MEAETRPRVALTPARLFWRAMKNSRYLYFMTLPFAAMVLIFNYLPIYGWITSFENYQPAGLQVAAENFPHAERHAFGGWTAKLSDYEAFHYEFPENGEVDTAKMKKHGAQTMQRAKFRNFLEENAEFLNQHPEYATVTGSFFDLIVTVPGPGRAETPDEGTVVMKTYFMGQEWVGLENYVKLFRDDNGHFYNALKNTLGMSLLSLIIGFVFPIIFAILLNELRMGWFKRWVQTISYLPHFVSWVVVAGIVYKILSTDGGPINQILVSMNLEPVQFMGQPQYFWGIVVGADLWKELGWNTIIYLAAITAIDQELYEAARVDGAGRWKQIWHITLPGISNLVVILLILSIGNLINIGFEKQFQLMNPVVQDSAEVLDLYALKYGIQSYNFGLGTAISVTSSVVSLILLFTANGIFRKKTGQSVM